MKLKLGGTLEIGDPILVSYGHGMCFGLFAGYGRGTIQYYTPSGIIQCAERAADKSSRIDRQIKPTFYKGYIHGDNKEYRVAKINSDVLYNIEDAKEYEQAIEILKLENIIK